MSASHTPGPWRLEVDGLDGHLRIVDTRGEIVSDIGYARSEVCDDEEHAAILADHRLMAAAPDLLAALAWQLRDHRDCACEHCAVLAKAKGGA